MVKKSIFSFLRTALFILLIFSSSSHARQIQDFSELAEKLTPSVVSVSVMLRSQQSDGQRVPQFPPGSPFEEFFKDFFERRGVPPRNNQPRQRRRTETAMGSGFIIDKEGLIVTNNHVIANASSITVILYDGTSLQAKLIGADAKTDLALLKVETDINLTVVEWGDSNKIKVGNWALAIGNPFGLVNTVTAGIVSAIARDINAGPFDDFIQTDAPINRGNSGGPLFNLDGKVIGVNTAIYSPSGGSVGIGFAIPSSLAINIVSQLNKYGKTIRGWLGVRIQTVTPDLAENLGLEKPIGALVASIVPNSPAEKAGIKPGDIILKFNNKDVNEMRKLPRLVAEAAVNDSADVIVWRSEKEVKLKVVIAEMKEAEMVEEKSKKIKPLEDNIKELGLMLANITDETRLRQNIPEEVNGLLVLDVMQNTDAERKGIRPGDIIQEINQKPITGLKQFKKEVKMLSKKKKAVLLLINRQGNLIFTAVKFQN